MNNNSETAQNKRPVGRPPKRPPARRFEIQLGTHVSQLFSILWNTVSLIEIKDYSRYTCCSSITTWAEWHSNTQSLASHLHSTPNLCNYFGSVTATTAIEPQVVDTEQDDEDGADGLLNDGLGDEEEESDDEEQPEDTAGDLRPAPQSIPRRKLPHWLQTQFEEKLRLASIRNSDGLPPLYERDKTFWFPVEDPYFALQHITSLSPQKIFFARFFLWDPAALLGSARIPCPNCRSGLNRHCPIPRPRRCVDLNNSFWVIGYRYICPSCTHPKSKKKTVTFRSWDPRIIRNLPNSLARSFPVRLTHRGGISDDVFMFMRSCFQSGMGAKQFSDALRVRHLEHYEALEIKYLSALAKLKGMSTWLGRKDQSFLAFEDTTPDGYHGFVPSSQWLRDLYDRFIEDHDHDFNQAIALLTGLICAIDQQCRWGG
ncbi:hypothetical protein B0H12DRAFT_1008596 [Mycena haematopus]|nr:hypothetical protein B0H12DRAFT_1008596 [Mycena haematopus]